MTAVQLIKAALHGGRRMTASEISAATGLNWNHVAKVLAKRPEFVPVAEREVITGRRGGNKAVVLWAIATPGIVPLPQQPSRLGPEGPGRGEIRDSDGTPSDSHDYGTGIVSIAFEPSTETVQCAREPRTVVLAACLDGYVDATATGRKSPCNQCPTGRARRAAYAGCDFEEEGDE